MKPTVSLLAAAALACAGTSAGGQERPAAASAHSPSQVPFARAVLGGVPPPDAGVADVGACVWASKSENEKAFLAAVTGVRLPPRDARQYAGAIIDDALGDKRLVASARACDPKIRNHWRYSVLAGAAFVEREVSLSRLAGKGLTAAKLDAAWAQADRSLRETHRRLVEAYLRGTVGEQPVPDLRPVYDALGLPARSEEVERLPGALSAAQAAVLEYFFARDLHAMIVEHMTRSGYADRVEVGAWVLDSRLNLARYYRELEVEFEGSATAECTVTAEGGLTACTVLTEEPSDAGFRKATPRMLATYWHVRMDAPSAPTPGQRVRVRVEWRVEPA